MTPCAKNLVVLEPALAPTLVDWLDVVCLPGRVTAFEPRVLPFQRQFGVLKLLLFLRGPVPFVVVVVVPPEVADQLEVHDPKLFGIQVTGTAESFVALEKLFSDEAWIGPDLVFREASFGAEGPLRRFGFFRTPTAQRTPVGSFGEFRRVDEAGSWRNTVLGHDES